MGETCQEQRVPTQLLTNEIKNITDNLKSSLPNDIVAVKERVQQKLLRLMNSVEMSRDLTALKQLEISLNAAENLFI